MKFSIFLNLITLITVFSVVYLFYVMKTKKDSKNIFEVETPLIELGFDDPDEGFHNGIFVIEKEQDVTFGKYDYMF